MAPEESGSARAFDAAFGIGATAPSPWTPSC
jgi:hypothetical protein